MVEPTFWPKKLLVRTTRFLVWCLLTVVYWKKKKPLPRIKQPLLLKSAKQLAEEIRHGKLKSVEVLEAYINRIQEVEPYINAVVQDRFEDALKEAKAVDAIISSGIYTSQDLAEDKPLLGVPFTVKLLIEVKGFRSTKGSLLFKDRIAKGDAVVVALLKKAGGILLATTNIPEFGFSIDSYNFVHGRTCNPYDTTRTSGGSSGGESALLGAAGSVIGIGNDLIGSIRTPAHFCGLFAHKATVGWISNEGAAMKPIPEIEDMVSTGPMCRYAEDLVTMVKILSPQNQKKLIFNQPIDFKKVKIYFQTEVVHAFVPPTDRDIVRAIMKAVSHFEEKYGVHSKKVRIPMLNKTNAIVTHTLQGHGNLIEIATDGLVTKLNGFVEIMKWIFGKSLFTIMVIVGLCIGKSFLFFRQKDVPFYEKLNEKLKEEFNSLLDETSIFLCPTFPVPAPYFHEGHLLVPGSCFTSAFNCTGMPVTQCPMGLSKKGMPLGIQIVGRKGNDALTLACAVELEKVFGGWIPPPNSLLKRI